MSRSQFIQAEDFESVSKLSVFCSKLSSGSLINIETIKSPEGHETYRVWYYS